MYSAQPQQVENIKMTRKINTTTRCYMYMRILYYYLGALGGYRLRSTGVFANANTIILSFIIIMSRRRVYYFFVSLACYRNTIHSRRLCTISIRQFFFFVFFLSNFHEFIAYEFLFNDNIIITAKNVSFY